MSSCTFWRCLALPWVLLLGLAAQAEATDIFGPQAVFGWQASTGPVTSYAVYVDRNGGGFPRIPDLMTPVPLAFVRGEPGDTIRMRVAAYSFETGEFSDFSDVASFRFVPPEPPAPPETELPLLKNGSFEQDGPEERFVTVDGGQYLPGWKVFGDSIDWKGDHWPAADGHNSLDLNGFGAGGVWQHVATEPGRFYYVYYSLAANPACGPEVKSFRIAAASDEAFHAIDSTSRTRSDLGWFQPDPFVFLADSDRTKLQLQSQNGSACGPTLDDVVVRAGP